MLIPPHGRERYRRNKHNLSLDTSDEEEPISKKTKQTEDGIPAAESTTVTTKTTDDSIPAEEALNKFLDSKEKKQQTKKFNFLA